MSNPIERIQVEHETIGHALKDKRLQVPVNQRSYAWEEEHVKDLYQDLAGAISKDPEYFLGSIVIIRTEDDKIEVNDGQQRLATTTILMAAIRDFFLSEDEERPAKSVEDEFLMNAERRSQELIPHLRLNNEDHTYYFNRVFTKTKLRGEKGRQSRTGFP